MEADKLTEFIGVARQKQVDDGLIVALLRQRGWPEKRIFQAFAAYYERELGMPVPERGFRTENARDAFLYLLAFFTLGWWVVSSLTFLDSWVDYRLPDPVAFYALTFSSFASFASWQLAVLIVAFPLFMFISYIIARETARRPEAADSAVRRWLTYIALVITAIILAGVAVAIVAALLRGDLTARFGWKSFALFVVSASIFSYYFATVRASGSSVLRNRIYGGFATVAVLFVLILGFLTIGSPGQVRSLALDNRRVSVLRVISSRVTQYYKQEHNGTVGRLPSSLESISLIQTDLRDPLTMQPFEYLPGAKAGTSEYRLCARFDLQSRDVPASDPWYHPAGHYCFALDAKFGYVSNRRNIPPPTV